MITLGHITQRHEQSLVPHILQFASVTFGHRRASSSTNFVRKLFTFVASEQNVDSITLDEAIDDLA